MKTAKAPVVWAIRSRSCHKGVFVEEESLALYYARLVDKEDVEVRSFNLRDEWRKICEFFDAWGAADLNRANSFRAQILERAGCEYPGDR